MVLSDHMESLLRQLLNALERVGRRHEGLYDTDVREQMVAAVYDGFIRPRPGYVLPNRFGLDDEAANVQVRVALARYLELASAKAAEDGLNTARARLDAFQNRNVHSSGGEQYSDDFFGWMDASTLQPEETPR